MRINKFLAQATGLSRRAVDALVQDGKVRVNGRNATAGHIVTGSDTVLYDGKAYSLGDLESVKHTTLLVHKPAGYVVSRNGQGSKTIYDLLPPEAIGLKPVGRLDKDSSGLMLMTSDGDLANKLTHPSFGKVKTYEITLDKPLAPLHRQMISDHGIILTDGVSRLQLDRLRDNDDRQWLVTMHEGRNRQIRRTFESLGYTIRILHRVTFGNYSLCDLSTGSYEVVQDMHDA